MSIATTTTSDENHLVQFILLRKDLNWSFGALATQAVHASNLCLLKYWHTTTDNDSIINISLIEKMHTILKELKNLKELEKLESALLFHSIDYVKWKEEPEGVFTAIAIKPMFKNKIYWLVKKFPLFK